MKFSLILPYWDRQEAANQALTLLAETYFGLEFEIIIVDDGNPAPFVAPDLPLDIKVIRLPEKTIPKCPVTAWNKGVEAASNEIIVLSCIEILHTKPVLKEMVSQVFNMGEKAYVLAAAFCPEDGSYHCHSSVKTPRNPTGTGIAFCAALHKSLFDKAGGFDEAYREGAGYEDNDWINRLLVAGARFVIRDDLEVIHPKTGATIAWGAERFIINEQLFYSKWPKELRLNSYTFCCVNAGDYLDRGQEYVDKLFDMVKRNLPDGVVFKFVCFTDEKGTTDGIEYRPLIADLQGWNNKISLFKDGVFEEGERVIYFDLDTLIVGRLDAILDYEGEFAVLRDFWRPEGLGPAVMMWRGGFGGFIWDEYEKADYPDVGDQEWLEGQLKSPAILQDMYQDLFCSYKTDCNPNPPQGARIICFHGLPRPHDVDGWVKDVWKIDGLTGSDLELVCNTELKQIVSNIHSSTVRNIPRLITQEPREDEVYIIGGGPSLADELEDIKNHQGFIISMNGTADYLAEHGIVPDVQIVIDARPENIKFLKKHSAKKVYLASQCHPSLFDEVDATLFHIALHDWDKYLPNDDDAMAVGGGHSVGLYAMSIAYVLGFRKMKLYGYDSSYRDNHHAYEQTSNDTDQIIEAHVNGRAFKTTQWMVVQVNEFQLLATQLVKMGCTVTTRGTGLLPYVAFQLMNQTLTT
jgi:uncharacterized Rossmann fold enzyme/glycosyltransferase involved in cell wall biosynthesis